MMKSLYAKLSVTFLLLLLLISALFVVAAYSIMRAYHEEVTQELNQNIAMYVADNYHFMQDQGDTDKTLQLLAERAMTINPSLEVYLLDKRGRVTNQMINPMLDTVPEIQQPLIDLEPVHAFLEGKARFPLHGNDPRDADGQKIFSAQKIYDGDTLKGYLYIVLDGQIHETIAANISSSYVLRTGLWYTFLILLSAILLSLWLSKTLTFRLNHLVQAVRDFRIHEREPVPIRLSYHKQGDEIAILNNTLCTMMDKINEQFSHLRRTDHLRRELISNVSHDLRTPLATTQGYIETLIIKGNTLSKADREKYLKIAERSTQHLSKLISDLFELSKLESGQVEASFEPFSLTELIYDTVQEFEIAASEKAIRLYTPSSNQNIRVCADIELIQRVLGNLLSNAIKFTPQGGSVSLGCKLHSDAIEVVVTDTGKGIAPGDLSKVFERHYFAKNAETNTSSAGLGLAIVKKILELHNSTISVHSSLNRGSQFHFRLPLL